MPPPPLSGRVDVYGVSQIANTAIAPFQAPTYLLHAAQPGDLRDGSGAVEYAKARSHREEDPMDLKDLMSERARRSVRGHFPEPR